MSFGQIEKPVGKGCCNRTVTWVWGAQSSTITIDVRGSHSLCAPWLRSFEFLLATQFVLCISKSIVSLELHLHLSSIAVLSEYLSRFLQPFHYISQSAGMIETQDRIVLLWIHFLSRRGKTGLWLAKDSILMIKRMPMNGWKFDISKRNSVRCELRAWSKCQMIEFLCVGTKLKTSMPVILYSSSTASSRSSILERHTIALETRYTWASGVEIL